MRLLLLSNSRDAQGRWLAHPRDAMRRLFGERPLTVAFVPYASVRSGWDDYVEKLADALAPLGHRVVGVHASSDPAGVVRKAEAIAVGGGNTFHLLRELYRTGVLAAVRERVRAGVPYLGWSAGSVVAGPTIRTTNDMPIVEPPSLDALGLVPFQINAHYTEWHPPGFMGETRRERLDEFVVANPDRHVVGLPEGSWLAVEDGRVSLGGGLEATVFRSGREPWRVGAGDDLGFLAAG